MTNRGRYTTWKRPGAGRCRNCGTLYIPEPHKGGEHKDGEVEEVDYCERCALRCPHCLGWLSRIEAEVLSQLIYNLHKDDATGKFSAWDEDYQDQKVLRARCPHCGKELDPGLFQF